MSGVYPVPADKVPPRGGRVLLEWANRSVALFNVADSFYAIDDSCPHQGASLCGGRLDGRVIQCCAHGLRFDLASGYLLNSTQLKVASYPVEQRDGQLFIVLASKEAGQ
ncbi:Ferredoxin subunit of nitrite reductase or a ring-hydroxylating dioxygenase [Pseudomonas sp. UC 17F4]|uniref:Rieske (2Fe-2S) protein n=1 Tax=Pseudomonas sp. UC 17F4 TaxID=1855328 RepID=UPI00088E51CC|nr:Rieske 2Fe-2S domain-containing protein [Pseudomonas sp. UC 17F4]SDQ70827.1 Ferredoxin subunit of nitrite reductase or a ring-hydroxylating dioxygenase [Pseudomonas sp. UC 17F4]